MCTHYHNHEQHEPLKQTEQVTGAVLQLVPIAQANGIKPSSVFTIEKSFGSAILPPHAVTILRMSYRFVEDVDMHVFVRGLHQHSLGLAIHPLIIRSDDSVTDLGVMAWDTGINATNVTPIDVLITKGDELVVFCSFNNTKSVPVLIG